MALLRRQGNYVVALDFVHANKRTFKFIRTFCPFVQSLSLVFDKHTSWIDYDDLVKFFTRMPLITTLQIRFDAFQFSPAMFWSLARVPQLTSLTMDVFYEKYHCSKYYQPDDYLAILDCCPNLEELAVCGLFLEPAAPAAFHKNSFSQWMKKTLRLRRGNTLSTPQEALDPPRHSRSWSSGSNITRLGRKPKRVVHQKSISDSTQEIPSIIDTPILTDMYRIRKLDLRSPRMDDMFCKLTSRCPLLEELNLDGVWVRISDDSWKMLSVKCPRLRSFAVRNSGAVHYLPSLQDLLMLFPRLDSAAMMAMEFDRDPDLSTLGAKLREIENQRGEVHPLKHIHVSGSILKPLKVLLHVVTQCSTVESLSVGFTVNALRRVDNEPRTSYDLDKRWLCQDSLTHLDLTSISFADKTVFSKFFDHVQRLTRLRSLWISVSHIREAWAITAINRGGSNASRHCISSNRETGSLTYSQPSASTPALGGSSSRAGSSSSHIHTSFFCFPALEILRIGMACYLSKKWFEMPVVFDEVVYMIDATPLLRCLELKHMSESGVLKRLSAEYPKIEFS